MDENFTLSILRNAKKKKLNISPNATIKELVEKGLQLFKFPINDISIETYQLLIGSKLLNKNENLNQTLYDKGIEEDDIISIYLTSEIVLGKFLIQYK